MEVVPYIQCICWPFSCARWRCPVTFPSPVTRQSSRRFVSPNASCRFESPSRPRTTILYKNNYDIDICTGRPQKQKTMPKARDVIILQIRSMMPRCTKRCTHNVIRSHCTTVLQPTGTSSPSTSTNIADGIAEKNA